jgi:hypothetical protein
MLLSQRGYLGLSISFGRMVGGRDSLKLYPTVGPTHVVAPFNSRQYPNVPNLITPAYSPVEYLASRKYIDLSKGVLNETRAKRMAEARQRIVPDVACRGRNTILQNVALCQRD